MRILPEFVTVSVTQTGTLASGSPSVTGLSDTSKLVGAVRATGAGIPTDTFVLSIDSGTQLTLTNAANASNTTDLTFTIEPLTLPEAKAHLRLEIDDDNALVADLIASARRFCEEHQRRAYLTQSRTLYLDSFPSAGGYYNRAIRQTWPSLGGLPSGLGFYPGMIPNSTGVIDIPFPPLQSIVAVKYYDFSGTLQTFDPANYDVSLGTPARIQPVYSKVWPISRPTIDSVQITFTCGYGDTADKIPSTVRSAMRLLIGHLYENREATVSGSIGSKALELGIDALLAVDDSGTYV